MTLEEYEELSHLTANTACAIKEHYSHGLLWYASLACKALGVSMSEVMYKNIKKLEVRYPNLYSRSDALNRNLDVERKELEK
jgi:hypothetical protein